MNTNTPPHSISGPAPGPAPVSAPQVNAHAHAHAHATGDKNQRHQSMANATTTATDPLDFDFGFGLDLTCIEPLGSPPRPNLLVPSSPHAPPTSNPNLHDLDFTSHPHSPLGISNPSSNNTSVDHPALSSEARTTQVTPNGTRIRLPKSRLRELTLEEINRKRKLASDSCAASSVPLLSAQPAAATPQAQPHRSDTNAIPHSFFPTVDLLVNGLNTTDDTCITSSSAPPTSNKDNDDQEPSNLTTQFNDDNTIPNLTSLLLHESDNDNGDDDDDFDQHSPSSLDLDEYALIEALNLADNDLRLDTLSLLTESHKRQPPRPPLPPPSNPTNVRATGPSRIPRLLKPPTSYSRPSSSLPSPPRKPLPSLQHTHHISPLSAMDPQHLAHLGKVYGLALTVHSLTLSLAALADLRKSAGLAASLPGPTSTAALAEAVSVHITMALPNGLGTREFHTEVRHSVIARVTKDKDTQHVVPSVEIPLNLAEPVPVHFDADLVQVFLQQALQVNLQVSAKPPRSFSTPRSKLAASAAATAAAEAHESVRLVHIVQANAFTYTSPLPLFTSTPDKRYLGALHLTLSLLPTPTPADLVAPAAMPPSPAPSPPLSKPMPIPPPPFPLTLTLTLGTFTPLAPARASVQTHPSLSSSHAHPLRMHLSTSLYLSLRLLPAPAPPMESKPVHWTRHVVDQLPGKVADQVAVAATVAPVDFETRWNVPVTLVQLAPWIRDAGTPMCVEVWSVVERVVEGVGEVDRGLVGVVKVPIGQVVASLVAGVGRSGDGWERGAVPVGLEGVECPVVDVIEGRTKGWVEVGVGLGRRTASAAGIAFGNVDRGEQEEEKAVDIEQQALPSAHVYVRFHTLCGMSTLAKHTATSLLAALNDTPTPPPISPAHQTALAALAADPSALNLYTTLTLLPKHLARQLATDPQPVTSPVAWHAPVPQWSAVHAGSERVWHGVSDEVIAWLREGTSAVAVGKVWHRFEDEDVEDGEVPDLLVGEFRIPLARLVERAAGWAGAWFPVHAPRVVGVGSGVTGEGVGISVPSCYKVANVLVDVGFDDVQVGGVGDFAGVRVKIGVVADVRSVEIREGVRSEWEVGVDVGSVFGEAGAAGGEVRSKRPVMWDGEVDITAAVLQHVLEGKLVVRVFDGGAPPGDLVGFAHVDTFALAHALLRLVNSVQSMSGDVAQGRVVADRVAFREHVVCPESSEASGLVVSGSVNVRVVGVQHAADVRTSVDEEVQVGPLPEVSATGTVESSPSSPKQDAFTLPLRPTHLISDTHVDNNHCNDDNLLPIQITIIQASGFALSRPHAAHASPIPNVYVSFVWSTDSDTAAQPSSASFLASSVLTLANASHAADRHLITSPAVAPETTPAAVDDTSATWAFTTTVMQSTSRHALLRLKHKKVIVFKLWQQTSTSSSADADLLIGFAKVDVSPLANGLRELYGWYNITGYRGGIAGQVHVRIRPVPPVPEVDEEDEELGIEGQGWVGQLARSAMMSSRQRRMEQDVLGVLPQVPDQQLVQDFQQSESATMSMTSSTSVSLDVVSLGPLPDERGGQTAGGDLTSDSSSSDEEDDETLYREPIHAAGGAADAVTDSTTTTSSMSTSPLHSLPSSPIAHSPQAPATPLPLGVSSAAHSPSLSTSRAYSASRRNSPSVAAAFVTRTSTPTTSSDLLPYRPGLAWSDSDNSDSDLDDDLVHSTTRSPARYPYAGSAARPFAASTVQSAPTEIGLSAIGQMREHARAIQAQIDEVVRKFGIHD